MLLSLRILRALAKLSVKDLHNHYMTFENERSSYYSRQRFTPLRSALYSGFSPAAGDRHFTLDFPNSEPDHYVISVLRMGTRTMSPMASSARCRNDGYRLDFYFPRYRRAHF